MTHSQKYQLYLWFINTLRKYWWADIGGTQTEMGGRQGGCGQSLDSLAGSNIGGWVSGIILDLTF